MSALAKESPLDATTDIHDRSGRSGDHGGPDGLRHRNERSPGAEQPSGPVSDEGSGTIKVAYQKFGNYIQGDKLFAKVKEQFEAENSSYKVELIPIEASQNDYFTKLALMNRSESTAPDTMYEDTYMIRSDVDAGYLRPLDDSGELGRAAGGVAGSHEVVPGRHPVQHLFGQADG